MQQLTDERTSVSASDDDADVCPERACARCADHESHIDLLQRDLAARPPLSEWRNARMQLAELERQVRACQTLAQQSTPRESDAEPALRRICDALGCRNADAALQAVMYLLERDSLAAELEMVMGDAMQMARDPAAPALTAEAAMTPVPATTAILDVLRCWLDALVARQAQMCEANALRLELRRILSQHLGITCATDDDLLATVQRICHSSGRSPSALADAHAPTDAVDVRAIVSTLCNELQVADPRALCATVRSLVSADVRSLLARLDAYEAFMPQFRRTMRALLQLTGVKRLEDIVPFVQQLLR